MSNEKNTPAIIDPEEVEVADAEAVTSPDTYLHTFSKPFSYEGNTYKELFFDWGSLTAEDSLAIENECAAIGKTVLVPEISGEYMIRMAVRACVTVIDGRRLGVDAFKKMPLGDYNRIRGRARSFLLRSGL